MCTAINPKLVSWASDIEPDTIRQAEKADRPATELSSAQADKAAKQFGTLGSGNRVWVVLHGQGRSGRN